MMRLKRYNEANAMFVIYFLYAVSAKKMLLISFDAIIRCPVVLVVHACFRILHVFKTHVIIILLCDFTSIRQYIA